MAEDERMDVEKQVEALNNALALQLRSVLHYVLTAGSIVGLEFQSHADKMRGFALAEIEDSIRLVEKITAIGGEPDVDVQPPSWTADPVKALDDLIEDEGKTLEALQAAIEPTGREAASEAIEHRLEHIIMRKQEAVDYLLRAKRRPSPRAAP